MRATSASACAVNAFTGFHVNGGQDSTVLGKVNVAVVGEGRGDFGDAVSFEETNLFSVEIAFAVDGNGDEAVGDVTFASFGRSVEQFPPLFGIDAPIAAAVDVGEAQGCAILWRFSAFRTMEVHQFPGEFVGTDAFVFVFVVGLDEFFERREDGGESRLTRLIPSGDDDLVPCEDGRTRGGGGTVGLPKLIAIGDVEGFDTLNSVNDDFVTDDNGSGGGGHGRSESFALGFLPDLLACVFVNSDQEVIDIVGAVENDLVTDDDGRGGIAGVGPREGQFNLPEFRSVPIEADEAVRTEVGDDALAIGGGCAAGGIEGRVSSFEFGNSDSASPDDLAGVAVDVEDFEPLVFFVERGEEDGVPDDAG